MVTPSEIICANMGQSQAFLVQCKKSELTTFELNKVHTVDSESQYILEQGQFIEDSKINGVLGTPRSFGDFVTKRTGAVRCLPEI
jgi:serine/threonine protein phosphatase PrpC